MIGIEYEVHVENYGWMPAVKNGMTAGTKDQSLRIEAIRFRLLNKEGLDVVLLANPHIENKGWTGFVGENTVCGTEGEFLAMQAIQFALRGADADKFSVQARAENVQNIGTMDWVTEENLVGTTGGNLRLEAIEIMITDKGVDLGNSNVDGFRVIEPVVIPITVPVANVGRIGNGQTVCINPGHGLSDPGAVGNLLEKDQNLTVALRLAQLLQERNFRVVLTRSTDIWMALSDRPAIANSVGADIFVSIHHNGSNDPNAGGTLVICYPGSTQGIRLSECVLNQLYGHLGLQQRGITQRDDSDVTWCDCPAIITEASFTSNPDECNFFNNGGSEKEAQGILEGILDYFGC